MSEEKTDVREPVKAGTILFFCYRETSDARSLINTYATARGIEQYPDGSFGVGDVSVDADRDGYTQRMELECAGPDRREVRKVFENIMRQSGLHLTPLEAVGMIVEG